MPLAQPPLPPGTVPRPGSLPSGLTPTAIAPPPENFNTQPSSLSLHNFGQISGPLASLLRQSMGSPAADPTTPTTSAADLFSSAAFLDPGPGPHNASASAPLSGGGHAGHAHGHAHGHAGPTPPGNGAGDAPAGGPGGRLQAPQSFLYFLEEQERKGVITVKRFDEAAKAAAAWKTKEGGGGGGGAGVKPEGEGGDVEGAKGGSSSKSKRARGGPLHETGPLGVMEFEVHDVQRWWEEVTRWSLDDPLQWNSAAFYMMLRRLGLKPFNRAPAPATSGLDYGLRREDAKSHGYRYDQTLFQRYSKKGAANKAGAALTEADGDGQEGSRDGQVVGASSGSEADLRVVSAGTITALDSERDHEPTNRDPSRDLDAGNVTSPEDALSPSGSLAGPASAILKSEAGPGGARKVKGSQAEVEERLRRKRSQSKARASDCDSGGGHVTGDHESLSGPAGSLAGAQQLEPRAADRDRDLWAVGGPRGVTGSGHLNLNAGAGHSANGALPGLQGVPVQGPGADATGRLSLWFEGGRAASAFQVPGQGPPGLSPGLGAVPVDPAAMMASARAGDPTGYQQLERSLKEARRSQDSAANGSPGSGSGSRSAAGSGSGRGHGGVPGLFQAPSRFTASAWPAT